MGACTSSPRLSTGTCTSFSARATTAPFTTTRTRSTPAPLSRLPEGVGKRLGPRKVGRLMRTKAVHSGLLGCLTLLSLGCGSNLVPAEGTVTLDGQPLANASVGFVPDEEGLQTASGTTDKNGRFRLMIGDRKAGALPGKYKVLVSKFLVPEIQAAQPTRPEKEGRDDIR